MKPLLAIAAIYSLIAAVNHLNPGPGDADVRGEAVTVGNETSPSVGATDKGHE